MAEVDLLRRYPKAKRNLAARHAGQTEENIRIACRFGQAYFDGPREQGYGGYRYDGRWIPIAEDMVEHFGLKAGDRVLDIGCAKGFLVRDLMTVCPGLEVFGLDISEYALTHAEAAAAGRLCRGDALRLPFPDGCFAAVISINTLHNLDRTDCVEALREIERVAPGRAYVQVDSYFNEMQRAVFLDWVLTARTHDYPDGWRSIFAEAGYTGDYYWTIME
ncbi:class I SAM-dependent methyltransferase [Azospirillum rugosum]|uniref:SAM-dependent methyltransferase n=1 Tax=Azospirillum rugosum TaxID=416170 RepID=A0ABS4SNZ7_9PROT|nr:class I SAM-dependent methyltransferase [Azospirillum rugosum]MBP2294286.1 SAM-dependent methyltransferase [Azospirillum rugosum]MDQ0527621.1 SAM-dependent methyltransferase [Azospirillum rugosum]